MHLLLLQRLAQGSRHGPRLPEGSQHDRGAQRAAGTLHPIGLLRQLCRLLPRGICCVMSLHDSRGREDSVICLLLLLPVSSDRLPQQ